MGLFAVTSQYLNEADKCQSYDVTVRSAGFFYDVSDPACQEGRDSSGSKIEYDLSLQSFGVTIGIPSLGLSFIAFSQVSETQYFEGVELEMYQVTLTI